MLDRVCQMAAGHGRRHSGHTHVALKPHHDAPAEAPTAPTEDSSNRKVVKADESVV